MKILVVQFSSLSEIILASPVIRVLKSDLQHKVHFATMESFKSSTEANPYIDHIHLLYRSFSRLVEDLRKENFDLIIDLDNTFKTRFLKFRLRTKSISFKGLRFKKWLMTKFKINLLPNEHVTERYMKLLESLGGKMDSLGLDYFIPDKDEVEENWLPESHQKGYAVFAIGGDYATKKLPTHRMIELCDRINKPIILLGNEEDVEVSNEIEKFFKQGTSKMEKEIEGLNKKAVIFNACGKFSINQAASVISQANWVFTHDSTMMHIAAAFKKPIFSIWGNTIPTFGMYPFRTQFTIFENKELSCRPCSVTGFNMCPKGHFNCMEKLVFDFYLPD